MTATHAANNLECVLHCNNGTHAHWCVGLHLVAAKEHDWHAAAQEAMAMAAAGTHPNIVRYHSAWMEDAAQPGEHHVYILMEACTDSLVGQRVVSQAPMREPELLDLLRQARSRQSSCH